MDVSRHITYGYDFTWKKDGGWTRVSGNGFPTPELADLAFKQALDAFEYEPPKPRKWWEFWRRDVALPAPYRKTE